jgi:hypothetical protein
MAKTQVQRFVDILEETGASLAANALLSGSITNAKGFSRIRGIWFSDVATTTGCGVRVEQSSDNGATWPVISASQAVGACGTATFDVAIVGNAVRVAACNAGTIASNVRTSFYLLPMT